MKASYRWIAALLPGLDVSPQALAERFNSAGLAVDGMTEYGAGTATITIATVLAIEPHPKREKLRLVTVDCGGFQQRVVCGASNVPDPGGQVCFAPLGTHLPAVNLTLAPREIGGVVSEGMLCSETELGLVLEGSKQADDHGILVFPPGFAAPGTPLRTAVPSVHDFIYELDLTPNRPDALGHVGLARDAAALLGSPFEAAVAGADEPRVTSLGALSGITVEDTERCPHYGAAMVLDVTVGPSPLWVRHRLESLGVRSISNIVDITNLVMLEFGHPLHTFDLDRVRGGKIVVRRAAPGEKLKTLDGVERMLVGDDLVIADGEGPLALAGVMGGEGSEITPDTRRVLIECAYFTTRGIRRSSRRHALHTDASHRFERGVDPGDIPAVLARTSSLLMSLAGGRALKGTILAGVELATPAPIRLRMARMTALLGMEIPFEATASILKSLGFKVGPLEGEGEGAAALVVPPTHRPDVHGEADLVDEVLRVHGLDRVPTVLPAIKPMPPRPVGVAAESVRKAAIAVGLSEAVTLGFASPKDIAALGLPEAPVVLKNPLGEERSVMRTTLLPGLLEALHRARRHGVSDVRLFTVGPRFLTPDPVTSLPDEVPSFAAVIAGARHAVLKKPVEVDVYDAKGVAVEIVERVTGRGARVVAQPIATRATYLHPRAAGNVLVDDTVVGSFGQLHPDVADLLDIGGPCVIVELDVRVLDQIGFRTPKYQPIPVLPAATRDIALVVHEDVNASAVSEAIHASAGETCESVDLFDVFQGDKVPAEHRSLAFHVIYRDPKAATDPEHARTLTDEEVDRCHTAVVASVKQKFGAVLRG